MVDLIARRERGPIRPGYGGIDKARRASPLA